MGYSVLLVGQEAMKLGYSESKDRTQHKVGFLGTKQKMETIRSGLLRSRIRLRQGLKKEQHGMGYLGSKKQKSKQKKKKQATFLRWHIE